MATIPNSFCGRYAAASWTKGVFWCELCFLLAYFWVYISIVFNILIISGYIVVKLKPNFSFKSLGILQVNCVLFGSMDNKESGFRL